MLTDSTARVNGVSVEQWRSTIQSPGPSMRVVFDAPVWLEWRLEQKPGEKKPRKVPYYAGSNVRRNGTQGSAEDRARLVTFDQVQGHARIGHAMLPDLPVTVIDLDGCVDSHGAIEADAWQLALGTYAELSPSKTGVHVYFAGTYGRDAKNAQKVPFGVEVFSQTGYLTFTGESIHGEEHTAPLASIETVRATIDAWLGEDTAAAAGDAPATATPAPAPVGRSTEQLRGYLKQIDAGCSREEWLRVLAALHHETGGSGEGLDLADEWSGTGGAKYAGREDVEGRWQSFRRETGRVATLAGVLTEHGINPCLPEDFEDLGPLPSSGERPRFAHTPLEELLRRPPMQWLIDQVVPKAQLLVQYGESGSGKSFLAWDMGLAIARGVPWRDRRTRQARVVYVALEGKDGLPGRLLAYQQHHNVKIDQGWFRVIERDEPNLLEKRDAAELAKQINAEGGADVVIIDTLSQATPGGDEGAKDMTTAVGQCKVLHQRTQALVWLVHHSGKDASKGARGHSSLRAAADAELETIKSGDDRAVTVTKQKNGRDGAEFAFKLSSVQVGPRPEDISCVIAHSTEGRRVARARGKLGDNEQIVLRVVDELTALIEAAPAAADVLAGAVDQKAPPEDGKVDRRRWNVGRALDKLVADGLLMVRDGKVSRE